MAWAKIISKSLVGAARHNLGALRDMSRRRNKNRRKVYAARGGKFSPLDEGTFKKFDEKDVKFQFGGA